MLRRLHVMLGGEDALYVTTDLEAERDINSERGRGLHGSVVILTDRRVVRATLAAARMNPDTWNEQTTQVDAWARHRVTRVSLPKDASANTVLNGDLSWEADVPVGDVWPEHATLRLHLDDGTTVDLPSDPAAGADNRRELARQLRALSDDLAGGLSQEP